METTAMDTVWHEILQELIFTIAKYWFFLLDINFFPGRKSRLLNETTCKEGKYGNFFVLFLN